MRARTLIGALSMLPVVFWAAVALAVNPHDTGGDRLECHTNTVPEGTTVTCTGELAGLGTGAVIISVDVPFACETKKSKHQPPGHIGGETKPVTPDHGHVEVDVTTAPASCPGGLNPVLGQTATVKVTDAATGEELLSQPVPITP